MSAAGGSDRALPSAAFLDRDGTIIHDAGYLSNPSGVALIQGAAEAIRMLNEARVPVVIVTNQSGIGRGYFGEAEFEAVQAEVERRLSGCGARIDAAYHCPHSPEAGCSCRKPALGMYARAAADLGVELARAVYVGNRSSDVLPAIATGGRGLLVADPEGRYDDSAPRDCDRVPDLLTGVSAILTGSDRDRKPDTEEG